MQSEVVKVLQMREGSSVERCHLLPHVGSYSVGKHSFDMLCLLHVLYPKASANLVKAILLHDLAERWTGDVPGSAYESFPELGKEVHRANDTASELAGYNVDLTPAEQKLLKVIDKMELLLWCHDQKNMGNKNVGRMQDRLEAWFEKNPIPKPCEEFLNYFRWQRTTETIK